MNRLVENSAVKITTVCSLLLVSVTSCIFIIRLFVNYQTNQLNIAHRFELLQVSIDNNIERDAKLSAQIEQLSYKINEIDKAVDRKSLNDWMRSEMQYYIIDSEKTLGVDLPDVWDPKYNRK